MVELDPLSWRNNLIEEASSLVGKPFSWGETDCATVIRLCVNSAYDGEVFPKIPEIDSLETAQQVSKDYGTPEKILRDIGCSEVTINFVQCGDIVILPERFDLGSGAIYVRSGYITSDMEYGVVLLNREDLPNNPTVLRLPKKIE